MAERRTATHHVNREPIERRETSALFAESGEILRQLGVLESLVGIRNDKASHAAEALATWRETLVCRLEANAVFAANLANVDVGAAKADRASQMWALLEICIDDLDSSATAAAKLAARSFLLHVAWHEGARLTARAQGGNGPARSFFQFEAPRAKEAMGYAKTKKLMDKLAAVASQTVKDLNTAADELPTYDQNDTSSSYFPGGNLIEKILLTNDLFGAYLARIAFKKVPATIPSSNKDQAAYWYKYWKVSGGDQATLEKIFLAEANEVDALLPSTLGRKARTRRVVKR